MTVAASHFLLSLYIYIYIYIIYIIILGSIDNLTLYEIVTTSHNIVKSGPAQAVESVL